MALVITGASLLGETTADLYVDDSGLLVGAGRGGVDEQAGVVDVEVCGGLAEQRGPPDHQRHQASSPASRW